MRRSQAPRSAKNRKVIIDRSDDDESDTKHERRWSSGAEDEWQAKGEDKASSEDSEAECFKAVSNSSLKKKLNNSLDGLQKRRLDKLGNNDENKAKHFWSKQVSAGVKQPALSSSDDEGSSSDMDKYLMKPDEIDLNATKFKPRKNDDFEAIEKKILAGASQLSDSDSESESDEIDVKVGNKIAEKVKPKETPKQSTFNFKEFYDFTKKVEAAKEHVEKFERKKKVASRKKSKQESNIENLLAAGEKVTDKASTSGLHSSAFESDDESDSNFEEVADEDIANIVPKEGVQITVEMPGVISRQKKKVDLLAALKRRLNRVRKENQIYIHKVHLLTWIAHGNYVNEVLNKQSILAMALSLLPSQNSYPPDRADLKYLEQIVTWYQKAMKKLDQPHPKTPPLELSLMKQIERKEAVNARMFVYIFVCILRSLGLQCRLVLSLRVEPLRPPTEEMHTLSVKTDLKKKAAKRKSHEVVESDVAEKKPKVGAVEKKSAKSGKGVCDKSVNGERAQKSKSTGKQDDKKKLTVKKTSKITDESQPMKLEEKSEKNSKTNESKVEGEVRTKLRSRKAHVKKEEAKSAPSKSETTKTLRKKNANHKTLKNAIDNIVSGLEESEKLEQSTATPFKGFAHSPVKNVPESSGKTSKKESNNNTVARKRKVEGSKLKVKIPLKKKVGIEQLDGAWTSTDEDEDCNGKLNVLPQLDGASDDKPSTSKPNIKQLSNRSGGKTSEDEFRPSEKSLTLRKSKDHKSPFFDVKNDIVKLVKKSMNETRQTVKARRVKKRVSDSDSDYADEEFFGAEKKKRSDGTKVKRRVLPRKELDRRVFSSDDESGKKKDERKKKGVDLWVEVFLEAEEKWICADVVHGKVHCIKEIHSKATQPVSYVLSWDNTNRLKDVSARYCPNWNTVTRKLRIDPKWWAESIQPFRGKQTARDKDEDEDLAQQQLDQPLPKAISEYKDHPLYALKRHLLKFEGIYPPDALTLGYIRGEPVYSRDCVYTLHSREIWVKHAKVVKPNEQPYKIVKARPKYDKLSNQVITDKPLEIFGPWQVQDYEPPTAENGIVPRNAFGNVELFKACMLPKKTVHLQLPGLNKVAKKLGIDCAAAVVGFDFHGGWSHPTFDGFVVCEEFAETLVAAWEQEQEESERREQEKFEDRVYGYWQKLIKGLMIQERLKSRYNFGEEEKRNQPAEQKNQPAAGISDSKPKRPKFITKKKNL